MIIATLCYLSQNDKILMLYREGGFMSGVWTVPGGKWEPGETIAACAVREYREETGLELLDLRFRGTILFDNKGRVFADGRPAQDDYLVFVYSATQIRGELKQPEKGKLEWISRNQLSHLKVEEAEPLKFKLLDLPEVFECRVWHQGSKLDGFDGSLYRDGKSISLREIIPA